MITDTLTHRIATAILLDSPLLFAILGAVCSTFAFYNSDDEWVTSSNYKIEIGNKIMIVKLKL